MTIDYQAVARSGVVALGRGDARTARSAFERVQAAGRSTHQLSLLLAQACTMLDDRPAAHAALDHVLRAEPANLYALVMRGDLHAAAGDRRAAVSWYQNALAHAPHAGHLPEDLLQTLRRVETAVARSAADFHAQLGQAFTHAGIDPNTHAPRLAEALDILAGRATVQLQQPTSFFYPGLEPRAFFDRTDFDWVDALEAAAPAIRAEAAALLTDPSALAPYVVADADRPNKRHALLDDLDWSAFHLFHRGVPIADHAARCPATMAALAAVPLPYIVDRSPMALFSVLRPDTHIPPHCGMLNTRLICHLPLIVPEGCRLRVGNSIRPVVPGQMLIFDDSIEHEAWNDGDAIRVVLLFEIWRPDLDAQERAALTTLFEAIGASAPMADDQAGA